MTKITPNDSQLHSAAYLQSLLCVPNLAMHLTTTGWRQEAHKSDATPPADAVVTVAAQALTLHQLTEIVKALADNVSVGGIVEHGLNQAFGETVLTAPVMLHNHQSLKQKITEVSTRYRVELAVQRTQPELEKAGLLVMDMDSTVIQIECIDEIAKLTGLGDQVAAVTERAMRGEMEFKESLIARVACLEGVKAEMLTQIRDSIPVMPGAITLVEELKRRGWRVAIASGGFTFFANHLATRLGLDAAISNELEVVAGTLTGKVSGSIVDANVKAQTVTQLATDWNIPLQQTIAMGDGANDLLMMEKAGLGVACHAKPIVNDNADVAIRYSGLHALLYYMK
ncbi:phosphoserine phosphatase SerB [Alteromonas pelagimontana]|uniref:Phosphoserine phosphatase n=1 Tax=Alteromonas pelagimontana TaxID=1858656 RepID=A0A6M4MG96_9ALTE|nr:phosphoserine phosphatase SerB [Alteromonas pelagimontana]QJR82103.1 phosphoserine phosphatase SerB [Alteromonas pelagimontana]